MPLMLALIRAVNLGRQRTARMSSLREAFESLGSWDVQTLLASGNVIFETRLRSREVLTRRIEARIRRCCDRRSPGAP
jgi:uncharacterized protein (DUF1697 family)